jgi:hypothetical protein
MVVVVVVMVVWCRRHSLHNQNRHQTAAEPVERCGGGSRARNGSNHVNHVEGQHDPRSRRQFVFWWGSGRWIDGRPRDEKSRGRR